MELIPHRYPFLLIDRVIDCTPKESVTVIKNVTEAGVARGLERVEMSWVLDNNHATRHIIESIGGEISKRYRMYEKEL